MKQNIEVSSALKKFFSEAGYSQRYIADTLGISQQVVYALLNGRPFGKKSAKVWSDAFGFNPAWLITGEGKMMMGNSEDCEEGQGGVVSTSCLAVADMANALSAEILKLVSAGELYPRNAMLEKDKLIKEKDELIRSLNREIGALEAQITALGAHPCNKKVI